MIAVCLVVVVGLVALSLLRDTHEPLAAKTADPKEGEVVGGVWIGDDWSEFGEAALETAKRFVEAKDLNQAAQYIVGGKDRLEFLEEFYSRPGESFPNGFKKVVKNIPNSLSGIPYFLVVVKDLDGNSHRFVVMPREDGMLIDWAFSVAYGELSGEELSPQNLGSPKLVRLIAIPSSVVPETELIPDEIASKIKIPRSTFLRLTDVTGEESFYALIAPEAEKCHTLASKLASHRGQLPVQLRVVWNDDFDCLEIKSLESIWWFDFELVTPGLPPPTSFEDIVWVR